MNLIKFIITRKVLNWVMSLLPPTQSWIDCLALFVLSLSSWPKTEFCRNACCVVCHLHTWVLAGQCLQNESSRQVSYQHLLCASAPAVRQLQNEKTGTHQAWASTQIWESLVHSGCSIWQKNSLPCSLFLLWDLQFPHLQQHSLQEHLLYDAARWVLFLMTNKVSIYIKAVHMFSFSWEKPRFEQVSGQAPRAIFFFLIETGQFFTDYRHKQSGPLSKYSEVADCGPLKGFL